MKHLTLIALIFSMLVAVAISAAWSTTIITTVLVASLEIMFLVIDALKRATLSILKVCAAL